jgi:pyruvate formate lyase activating enzyme
VSPPEALVCDVQRFSLHDGPGVRTVVFFKGCPLRCAWCQNPEALRLENELVFSLADCIHCGDCIPRCPQGALRLARGTLQLDWSRCDGCLGCVDACPSRALTPAARSYDVERLTAEVLRDREFFGPGGGVTLSGGEPLLHVAFLAELVPRLKEAGLGVVVETSGHWRWPRVAPLLRSFDLLLYDVKVAPEGTHRALTGVGNRQILANLRSLLQAGFPVRVRTPLVPHLNAQEHLLRELAAELRDAGCDTLWLLPYHRLWESKLAKLGTAQRALPIAAPLPEEILRCSRLLAASGLRVHVESAVAG